MTHGGKRSNAGRLPNLVWYPMRGGWMASKQFNTWLEAFNAEQKISRHGLPCDVILYEDDFYHLFTRVTPYK